MTLKMSNDAENVALITEINYILKYIHIENILVFNNILFYSISNKIIAALVNIKDFFQNIKKSYQP